jgi:exonuclease I
MSNIDDKFAFEPTGFDYVNPKAEVVIVGITPGNSQQKGNREGLSSQEIKRKYAFAGTLRKNMVSMLDYIGVNNLLGINSCNSLWKKDFDRVEMTSLLKDATYIVGKSGKTMFKDTEMIAKSEELTEKFENGFVKDCQHYKRARLFVACGQGVYNELMKLKERGVITAPVVAIAHPSGNNGVRVLYYMGQLDSSLVWCTERAKEAIETIRKTK